jgi:ATP-dependent helicase/nuclease subunit A
MYVGVPVGERVLEGFIDLLYETPDGLVVVDYKTDRLNRPEDAPSVVEQYRLQGAAYALATEQALGISVADCTFLFLTPTRAVPASIKDLAGAVAEAEAILKQPLPNSSGAGESPIT